MWPFSNNFFFFCLVLRSPCYTLSYTLRKKEKKNREEEIHGGSGSTWGEIFHMGTQNGSKLEI